MFRVTCIAAVSLLVAACGGRGTAPPDDEITDPAQLLGAMDARLDGVESIRIRAVLEYYGDEGRIRIRQAVAARRPGDLRLETISPVDTSLNILVANDENLVFYDIESGRFFMGEPTAEDVGRLVPLWFSPTDIVNVLLGAAPLDAVSDDTSSYTIVWDREEAAYRLTMPTPEGGELQLLVHDDAWSVAGGEYFDADGALVYELRTGELETFDDGEASVMLPTVLRFLMPGENIDITLEVDELTLNPELPDVLFELAPPNGVRVEQL